MSLLKKLLKITLYSTLIVVVCILSSYLYLKDALPSVDSLKNLQWQTPMQIYSSDEKLISQFGEKKRIPLTLNEFPPELINAILATEDDRFYMHFGVDPIGMGRAVLGQLMGKNKGGASTITMQVARNFFLSREVTAIRKIREIFLAFHIESLLSKDEILALYMNKIPLGHRSFGFGAAAQVYYGKEPKELTLAQVAVLAGLPKAPSTLNPIRSPKRAKARRAVVLHRMQVSGYITHDEMQAANNAPITGKRHGAEIELNAPYIAEMAHQKMISLYGKEEAYTAGYRVFTTVPSHLQIAAQKAVIKNVLNYDKRHGYRGPIHTLSADTTKEVYVEAEQVGQLPINENSNSRTVTVDNEVSTDLSMSEASINNKENEPTLTSFIVADFSNELIINALNHYDAYAPLIVAVVTDVQEKSVTIKRFNAPRKNTEELITEQITWQGLSWARGFINDHKQDIPPKVASDILAPGDVIYVDFQKDEIYLSQIPQVSSALVAISPDDGAIQAAMGGFSFKESQFNRVTQAKRQIGSNIKPFLYSAAVEQGMTLASIVNDAPINQWDANSNQLWRPTNSPAIYNGPIRVRLALAQSKNVVAVRLLREVGLTNLIQHIRQFGFNESDLPVAESLALGSASVTPLDAVTGFAVFANHGFLVEPYLIERIEDSFGNIVFKADPVIACEVCEIEPEVDGNASEQLERNTVLQEDTALNETPSANVVMNGELTSQNNKAILPEETPSPLMLKQAPRVISPQNAFLITEALNSVIWGADWRAKPFWQGTGFRARSLKRRDIAGKTGTTNDSKDTWFSGFSRRIAVTSWIGFDNPERNLGRVVYNNNLSKNQTTGSESGAKSAQPAWIDFMKVALASLPQEPFEQPEGMVSVRIDKSTGKLTHKTDNSSTFEYFIEGTEPQTTISQDLSAEIIDGSESNNEEIF